MVAVATEGKETPTLTTAQSVSHENEVSSQEMHPTQVLWAEHLGSISCANMNGAEAHQHVGTGWEIRGMDTLCLFNLLLLTCFHKVSFNNPNVTHTM